MKVTWDPESKTLVMKIEDLYDLNTLMSCHKAVVGGDAVDAATDTYQPMAEVATVQVRWAEVPTMFRWNKVDQR